MSSVSAHLLAIREVQISGGNDGAGELTLAARGVLLAQRLRQNAGEVAPTCVPRAQGGEPKRKTDRPPPAARPKRSFVGTSVA